MKIKDVRKKGEADLKKELVALKEELRTTRFESSGLPKKGAKTPQALRRTIARINTVLRETP
jgi:ribosomal protein L29